MMFPMAESAGISKEIKRFWVGENIVTSAFQLDRVFTRGNGYHLPFDKMWLESGRGKIVKHPMAFLLTSHLVPNPKRWDNIPLVWDVTPYANIYDGVSQSPFGVFVMPGYDCTVTDAPKYLREKRGFPPLSFWTDNFAATKFMQLTLNGDCKLRKSHFKEFSDFFHGKAFLPLLRNKDRIISLIEYAFMSGLVACSVLEALDNQTVDRDVVLLLPQRQPSNFSPIPPQGDTNNTIKISTDPRSVVISPASGKVGTPKREHDVRGHYRSFGVCKQGLAHKSELCDELAVGKTRAYCQTCGKRKTFVKSFVRGEKSRGRISSDYEID